MKRAIPWLCKLLATALLLASAALMPGAPLHAAPLHVVYPNIDELGATAFGYRALDLALKKSGEPYTLELLAQPANHPRIQLQLASGAISVADFGTSRAFERDFLPIYLPLDRGLNGWRVMVVRADDASTFAALGNIAQLRRYSAGQGAGWADSMFLENAGIRVVYTPQLKSLFPMLVAGRFDFVPLGLNEVYGFSQQFNPNPEKTVIDEHVLLVYPYARFFFVNKNNTRLRDVLRTGLTRAFEDGSFNELFARELAAQNVPSLARLRERTIIPLENPEITDAFRSIPKKYFYLDAGR